MDHTICCTVDNTLYVIFIDLLNELRFFTRWKKMEVNVSWLQFWAKMQHVAKFMTRTTTYFSLKRKFRCLWIKCTKTKSNSSIFCFDKIIVHEPFGLQSPYMPQDIGSQLGVPSLALLQSQIDMEPMSVFWFLRYNIKKGKCILLYLCWILSEMFIRA